MTPEIRRARAAYRWVGVIVPLAVLALAAFVVAAWLPGIPDPAAIHWASGRPDGFAPRWTHLLTLGVGVGLVVLFAVIVFAVHRMPKATPAQGASGTPAPASPGTPVQAASGHSVPADAGTAPWSATARLLGAAAIATAVQIATVTLVAVGVQRGLAAATDAPAITTGVLLSFALAIVAAVAGWFLQPKVARSGASTNAPAAALPLAGGERAVWVMTASIARTGRIVLGISLFVTIATTVLFLATGTPGGWIVAATALLLSVVVVTGLAFRVRASAAGLRVRSTLGWPRLEIPAADIASARTVAVHPFADFGGWGYRIGTDGRRGLVLRAGEAIEVTRTDGRRYVVTVDDAETGAEVLAAAAHPGPRDSTTGPDSTTGLDATTGTPTDTHRHPEERS